MPHIGKEIQERIEDRDGMRVHWDAPITAGDGVVLRCDVFRPLTEGRYAVIMTYGPYAKGLAFQEGNAGNWNMLMTLHPHVLEGSSNMYQSWELVDPEKWVPDGYVCVRVDSRGTGHLGVSILISGYSIIRVTMPNIARTRPAGAGSKCRCCRRRIGVAWACTHAATSKVLCTRRPRTNGWRRTAVAITQVQGGRIRALAVTTQKRSTLVPDLPSMADEIPGFDISIWNGVFARAGTPADVVVKLNAAAKKTIAAPDVITRLKSPGLEPAPMSIDEFRAFQLAEIKKWAAQIKAADIQPE